MGLETKVAGIVFSSYILNASGIKDTLLEELKTIGKSESSAIAMKSSTPLKREGNPEPRCAETSLGLIQSMGWPNLGYKEYVRFADLLKKEFDKPIIASVAGFNLGDYIKITSAYQKSSVDLIEISLSCPNIENHPQIGYDFRATDELLDHLSNLGSKPLGLKLPAYLDFSLQAKMAELISKRNIKFITSINSIGNSLIINPETESPIIKPRGGLGGLCGGYIKPIALGNVRGFYDLFKGEVSIFGVGGVTTGTDAFEFLLAGADAVQVGTVFEKEGAGCFERINREFREVMEQKNYKSIDEVRGRLTIL